MTTQTAELPEPNPKAQFFDVAGTVFDWKDTAREKIQELADAQGRTIDSLAFATDWRREMIDNPLPS